jgi:hypothetical protein
MRTWLVAVIATAALVLTGCSTSAKTTAPTTTTLPESLWVGQADVWLTAHSSTLTDISAAAKNLGDAAKADESTLTEIAAEEMEVKVGLADGTLPDNAFGHDMHKVFVEYADALEMIRSGILKNNEVMFKAGSNALANAVTDFAAITTRMGATATTTTTTP